MGAWAEVAFLVEGPVVVRDGHRPWVEVRRPVRGEGVWVEGMGEA